MVLSGLQAVYNNMVSTKRRGVINMSLGYQCTSCGIATEFNNMFDSINQVGGIIVVAAGNDNLNACTFQFAIYPQTISVGSHTSNGDKSDFSNHGECVDIWAPGSDIWGAYYESSRVTTTIGQLSGTSMAAPHITGIIANLLMKNNQLNTNDALLLLKSNTLIVNNCNYDAQYCQRVIVPCSTSTSSPQEKSSTSSSSSLSSNTPSIFETCCWYCCNNNNNNNCNPIENNDNINECNIENRRCQQC